LETINVDIVAFIIFKRLLEILLSNFFYLFYEQLYYEYKYFFTIVDDYTCFTRFLLMANKVKTRAHNRISFVIL